MIDPNAGAGGHVIEQATGAHYVIENANVGRGPNAESRVRMFLIRPAAGGQSRLVHADDARFNSAAVAPGPVAAPPGAGAPAPAPQGRPFHHDPDNDFTFEGWFNYFYDEVPDNQKAPFYQWGVQYAAGHHHTDAARTAILENMFTIGFIEYSVPTETAAAIAPLLNRAMSFLGLAPQVQMVSAKGVSSETQLHPGPDVAANPRYQVNLPTLAGTSLGYRADTRDWATIQQQQGSKAQARVPAPGFRAARNLNAPWNPFGLPARQQSMYLRKEHNDNCTRTAVSVAMDLRDTLTFPKPKPTSRGADTVTIYVVYAPRVLDTSAVAFDLWNADRWERGEVAAYEVPAEHHLARLDVERFYDPANGNYVVGRIIGHHALNSERWSALPPHAQRALRQLWTTLDTGQLRWFEWGTMNVGETRRRTIAAHDLHAAMHAPTEAAKIAALQTVYHQVRHDWVQARADAANLDATLLANAGPLAAAIAQLAGGAAPLALPVGAAAPPPPPVGGGINPMHVARQTVKNQLHARVVALRSLVNDRGVPGITRTLYPLYAELQTLDATPAPGITLALALQVQVALNNLLLPLQSAIGYIDNRLDAWMQRHDHLLLNGGLQTPAEWESFLSNQVMKDTGP
jgi:hypothetical protein